MKKRFTLSTTQLVMLSFFATIIVGSLLLSLPISAADGNPHPFVDALFTATTATCVTGLVTVTTATAWSTFGHIVILLLIQIGGLGLITIMAGIATALNRKMGLSDRLLLQDAFNLNSMAGLQSFVKKVLLGTFAVEAVGALLYMTVFVPEFGARGIWYSVFNSVSAFCNAGIDIIAEDSLCRYATNPIINFTTCALIAVGGIGFIVWWDVIRVFKDKTIPFKHTFRHLTLHSKIALTATALLIFGGALAILLFEYNNPLTIGNMSRFDKIQVAFFQSVTTRTAGFASVPQQNLTQGSSIISIILMFIGGSPVGTAGGIKTVTAAVLMAAAVSAVKNREDITLWDRRIAKLAVIKAIGVVGVFTLVVALSTLLLSARCSAPALDIVYETVSAAATVGLSRNLTPFLDTISKLIITATMYLGRIGPISLAVAFSLKRQTENIIKNPEENISVG